jgi:hypothetical protein
MAVADEGQGGFPSFPVAETLHLPDEELAAKLWLWWVAAQIERRGVPAEPFTPELVEDIRQATLAADNDNEATAGLEKILKLLAVGDFARAGPLIRAHFKRGALFRAALDEVLATGRRRQRAAASRDRTDALQALIRELVGNKPDLAPAALLDQLWKRTGGGVVEAVDDGSRTIEWIDGKRPHSTGTVPGARPGRAGGGYAPARLPPARRQNRAICKRRRHRANRPLRARHQQQGIKACLRR